MTANSDATANIFKGWPGAVRLVQCALSDRSKNLSSAFSDAFRTGHEVCYDQHV